MTGRKIVEADRVSGYMGKTLRINLTDERITEERFAGSILRNYIGGAGLGARVLYDEVRPQVGWSDPGNRLVFATGPLNGTNMAGSGTFCVVTKGCLTNGGTSSQANGYFGAYLKFSGYDGIILHGAATRWVYLFIHDGVAEIKDASHLAGKDTIETQQAIRSEIGGNLLNLSIYCIGAAGEHLVRFAAIMGDGGHVLAHNGCGAVMGSKKVKALVVAKGKRRPVIEDRSKLSELSRQMNKEAKEHPVYGHINKWGTSALYELLPALGMVPYKNLTSNTYPDLTNFSREHYGDRFEIRRSPCWACPSHHSQSIKLTKGPYAGLETDDPEYECTAAWGPLIGNNDLEKAVFLCDLTDRLGLDCNEAGWVISLLIECFEKGIVTEQDTDGLVMKWGNVEAVRDMLHKIAGREGAGNFLAEGVMRAAGHIGGEAPNMSVYVKKGHSPRMHDARARWSDILDYATGGVGTSESNPVPVDNPFSPEGASEAVMKGKVREFVDSLVVCNFATMTYSGDNVEHLVGMLNAATGWDFTGAEAVEMSMRTANLFRAFNIRNGIDPGVEEPSPRYGSAPIDGPAQGKSILAEWETMREEYFTRMGWDRKTGKPLPQTLTSLGLGDVVSDIW